MSLCDTFSYWRCPSCNQINKYNLTWQHFYKFAEFSKEWYSKEQCNYCKNQYYINALEPSLYGFKMDNGLAKNDYIKNAIVPIDEKLTVINEVWTD